MYCAPFHPKSLASGTFIVEMTVVVSEVNIITNSLGVEVVNTLLIR